MSWRVTYKADNWLSYFWSYHPLFYLKKISCPLCNSNNLLNISIVLGRNVEQDQTTCHVREWQLCLSDFRHCLPLLYLTVIIHWFHVHSVSQRPFGIFLTPDDLSCTGMTTLPFWLLALSPFVMSDTDYALISCPLYKSKTLWNIFFTRMTTLPFFLLALSPFVIACLGGSVGCAFDWRPGGRGFDPRRSRQHSFMEIDHEIFSTVILSLPLIQVGQLSVSGERMCTILVNRLEDKACPVNVWLGKLTALDMTPLGWLGRKTSTQTNSLCYIWPWYSVRSVNQRPFGIFLWYLVEM